MQGDAAHALPNAPKETIMYYFALFLPVQEGGYAVEFPDIPEAFTQGDTLEECMDMARDVLSIAVEEYARAKKQLPSPSPLANVREAAEKAMREPGMDSSREPLTQLFQAPEIDMTPVKLNISMTRAALAGIDEKARRLGMTRSGLLVRAAQAYAG